MNPKRRQRENSPTGAKINLHGSHSHLQPSHEGRGTILLQSINHTSMAHTATSMIIPTPRKERERRRREGISK
jgi:hypothetical protein